MVMYAFLLEYKEIGKAVIKTYTYYVRDKVKEGREDIIRTGIDEDIYKYKDLFLATLRYTLAIEANDKQKALQKKNKKFIKESKLVILDVLKGVTKGSSILTKDPNLLYTTCEVMFEEVVKELGYGN